MTESTRVAVIGHGETAALIASTLLAAGVVLTSFDPVGTNDGGPHSAGSLADAVAGADVILSLNSPAHSLRVAGQTAPLLKAGAVYADLNGGTPAAKKQLAELFPEGAFADVALNAQVGSPASEVSLEVSGTGAHKLMELLGAAGLAMEYVSEVPGDAAARGIVRSLLAKSVAAAVIDTLWAAESLGLAEWAHQEILQTFETASAQSTQNSLRDTAKNFKRRQMELMDVLETLRESGHASTMAAPIDYTYGSLMHGKKIPFSKLP